MAKRVAVTGGAGFIGSHLVERLVSAGDRVTAIDDLSRGRRAWLPAEAELVELDVRDGEGMTEAFEHAAPEVVVHLAAMHFIPAVDGAPELAWEVNVDGTASVLGALERRPPQLLLFASTAAVYPDRSGPIAESCPPDPLDLYGRTKLEGERLVARFSEQTGSRSVVARIFNVVGRRETNAHVVPELVGQLRRGDSPVRLGNLDARRDYTDAVDVAAALHLLLSAPPAAGDTFNLGSGRATSVADLVRACEESLGRPVEVNVERTRLRPQDRAELVADATLLRETTGWEPTLTIRDTLAKLLTDPEDS
jgi:UDP-glucose 4-epimerase